MNLFKLHLAAAVFCCTLAGGAVALGGIDSPPPWAGTGIVGNPTHWRWDFPPNPTSDPAFPSSGQGAPGTQPPHITGGTWLPGTPAGQGTGVWCLNPGQTMTIDMANFPLPNDFKLIWIQYHYFGGAEPQIGVFANGVTASPWGNTVTPSPGPGGGLIGAQGFRLPFNPAFETFVFTNVGPAPLYFEWLTIDTICAPTPGAGAALLFGGTALLRRRQRAV